jgi:hypothetical protein
MFGLLGNVFVLIDKTSVISSSSFRIPFGTVTPNSVAGRAWRSPASSAA